jgi:hypothetical protein
MRRILAISMELKEMITGLLIPVASQAETKRRNPRIMKETNIAFFMVATNVREVIAKMSLGVAYNEKERGEKLHNSVLTSRD